MHDTWRPKGLYDYREEAAQVPEQRLRAVLEKYARTPDKVCEFVPQARTALAYVLMLAHGDHSPTPLEIRRCLERVHKQASGLSFLLAALPSPASNQLRKIALADDDADLAGLGRGDPFSEEARLDDVKVAVKALARWAECALEGSGSAAKGRPAKGAPTPSAASLATLYKRLTGRAPSRVTRPTATPPYGHAEEGDFGRFARDFVGLIAGELSDDAIKRGIAAFKVKKPPEIRPNSPLDAKDRLKPE